MQSTDAGRSKRPRLPSGIGGGGVRVCQFQSAPHPHENRGVSVAGNHTVPRRRITSSGAPVEGFANCIHRWPEPVAILIRHSARIPSIGGWTVCVPVVRILRAHAYIPRVGVGCWGWGAIPTLHVTKTLFYALSSSRRVTSHDYVSWNCFRDQPAP